MKETKPSAWLLIAGAAVIWADLFYNLGVWLEARWVARECATNGIINPMPGTRLVGVVTLDGKVFECNETWPESRP
jgi:hypothetical protein